MDQSRGTLSLPTATELPSGTVTFLFTDIEGSTRLWERYPEHMRQVMVRHDEIIESLVIRQSGVLVRPRGEGDSRFAVFRLATDALLAASAIHRGLAEESWTIPMPLRVRIGVHTGETDLREGDYYGTAVNRCARLRSVAHGGQTLLSQSTYYLVKDNLPEGLSWRDLGEHKLKDLQSYERIYQLNDTNLPADFPPLRTQDSSFTNLPVALTSFIGRETELAELKELLTRKRLVTILGLGGAGKTRLAVQVTAEMLYAFPDGAWFVDLAPLSNSAHLVNYILSSLGLREDWRYSSVQTLVDFLRDKALLLLLDNCEHILDGIAPLVETLLQNAPKLKILATSRALLGSKGETVWLIPTLSLPKSSDEMALENLMQFEAVKLFVERALSVKNDFALTKDNTMAVAQICRQLDGIPLAIELAAARVRVLSVGDIAARLDDRFRLLVSNQNTVSRQKTLRNLIDWSYDLLPENERALIRRLSVFAGGWTLPLAEQICTGGQFEDFEVLDLLANLVDKSLVIAEFEEGRERYYFLETIRQYAQVRLVESHELDEFSRRHAQIFTIMAERASSELSGPNQGFCLDRLDMEQDNLRVAMEWLAQNRDGAEQLLRMTVSLWRYWEIRGALSEGRARLELALAHTPNASAQLRAHGLRGAGMLALHQGDYASASDLHQRSLALFKELEDKFGIGCELEALGEIAKYEGDYARSVELHSHSLDIRREIDDQEGVAKALGHLGMIARDRGQYQQAQELLGESLRLGQQLEDKLLAAQALNNLGLVAFNLCAYPRASELLEEALSLYRVLNDRPGISETLQNLGNVAKDQGDFQKAHRYYRECLKLKQELGDRRGIAQAISSQAEANFFQGNYPRAADQAEQSLAIFQALGVKRGVIFASGVQAYIAHYQGDQARAESLAREIIARAEEVGAPRPIAYAHEVLGMGAYARGALDEANTLFQKALQIFKNLDDQRNLASLWVNLARTAYRQGEHDSALHFLEQSLKLSRELEIQWTTSYALEIMGLLERASGRYERAERFFLESLRLAVQQANQQGIANCLGALAGIAIVVHQPARATILFAAAEKYRKAMGAQMSSNDQAEYQGYLDMLRARLEPDGFESAWSVGSSMTIEQIMAELCE